jgi:septal ring factor EnvC (AmiA/AmiB activator)
VIWNLFVLTLQTVWNVLGNTRLLHTRVPRVGSLPSKSALGGWRGSLVSISPTRAGFATSTLTSTIEVDGLNQWKDDIAELKSRRQQVDVEIKGVASQIAEVQSSIKDVVGRIDKSVVGSQEWTYLVDKEKVLRDEKKRLDDKEKRLDEEKKLLDEQTQLPSIQVEFLL